MYSLLKIHFYKQIVLFFLNICQKNKQVSTKIIPKQNACLTFLDEIHIFLKTLYFSDKICNFLKTLYFSFLRIFYLIKIWYIVSSNHVFRQNVWFFCDNFQTNTLVQQNMIFQKKMATFYCLSYKMQFTWNKIFNFLKHLQNQNIQFLFCITFLLDKMCCFLKPLYFRQNAETLFFGQNVLLPQDNTFQTKCVVFSN